ncbi:mycofactocin system glycosyltransferase [Nocardioides alpinus]|uniref:Mycofactocin system glycosyltransferase n=1 Tax=Nocardioides alpinus TaxID=748909 RepID=A0A1I1AXL2_9ACTN|nr:mycofactocin biosynthesis glycosyltransferase MftF [Nocardioides alpinus]PKH40944.1 mycofactocin system glycosyltransferase [Nocardioides alpinus]SFB42252.1 mycofactocin system glycosyltransferase [Nocardioides alpinus]
MSLPRGFSVTLDPSALRADGGRLLVGGSPLTALRLSPAAAARLDQRRLVVTDEASSRLADRLLSTNLARPDLRDATAPAQNQLTVVVPVRDRADQLDRCLAALHPLAVIVVDDASLDPAAVADVARRHGAILVPLVVNVGPAGARNAGLARVTTPVVAFVDSDVQVDGGDLLRLARHLDDPAVALVGPRVVGHSAADRPRWFERYDVIASSLSLGSTPATVRPGASVAWLPSACLVGRTALLGPGFDAAMRVGEDVDLVWRLGASGHRVRYDPDVAARHDVRTTVRGWLGRKLFYGTGGADLAERHGSHVAPAVLSPTMAVAGAALLLRRRWSLPVVSAAYAVATWSVARGLPSTVERRTRVRIAARLAGRGVGWAARQESALLLRHWWPVAAVGLPSAHVRRALATALVIDTCVAVREAAGADEPSVSLPVLFAGRRLDDLAYGTGLWWGALRRRSTTALAPRRATAPQRPSSRAAASRISTLRILPVTVIGNSSTIIT